MVRVLAAMMLVLPLLMVVAGARGTVTPVEKVMTLLSKLGEKIEAEGKAEAAAYDKYACFCKEQADEKQYNIEKSTKEISEMDAKIELLDTEITSLNSKVTTLTANIAKLAADIKNATEERAVEHAAYVVTDTNVTGAISAVESAIEALKNSKGDLQGKVDMDSASLAQVKSLIEAYEPGEAAGYKYHANDIISTLKSLRTQFIERKNMLDQEEFETNSIHEKRVLGMQNEKQFAEQESADHQQVASSKSEEKHNTEEERSDEQTAKQADANFMAELTTDCEAKATLFDDRSKVRSAEITAINGALEQLKKSSENWGANKKLAALQVRQAPKAAHWAWVEEPPATAKPASFLQLQGKNLRGKKRNQGHNGATEKVLAFLSERATSLGSSLLEGAVVRAMPAAGEDHFVKVRQMISDLVGKLKQEALEEASEKSFCDKEMLAATSQRDKQQENLESLEGQISSKNARKDKLNGEIVALAKAIAENARALAEAQELRDAEKAENEATIRDANSGLGATDLALTILNKFYGDSADGTMSFLQTSTSKYVPTNSDRNGQTLKDAAPEVFQDNYKGSQAESKGILGLLEVIKSDFERTISTVESDEQAAAIQFDNFKTTTRADTASKNTSKTMKEDQVTIIEGDLVELENSKVTAQTSLDQALEQLETLHSRCVQGSETYEQRVEKRKQEIEALKEAVKIFDSWQD